MDGGHLGRRLAGGGADGSGTESDHPTPTMAARSQPPSKRRKVGVVWDETNLAHNSAERDTPDRDDASGEQVFFVDVSASSSLALALSLSISIRQRGHRAPSPSQPAGLTAASVCMVWCSTAAERRGGRDLCGGGELTASRGWWRGAAAGRRGCRKGLAGPQRRRCGRWRRCAAFTPRRRRCRSRRRPGCSR